MVMLSKDEPLYQQIETKIVNSPFKNADNAIKKVREIIPELTAGVPISAAIKNEEIWNHIVNAAALNQHENPARWVELAAANLARTMKKVA
jgi:hypothetical protein